MHCHVAWETKTMRHHDESTVHENAAHHDIHTLRLTGLQALEYASRDRSARLMRSTLFGVHPVDLSDAYALAQRNSGGGLFVDVSA